MTIGVFDSGVGGLTVLKELGKKLPHENITYLGDTARVPYGTKSAPTVTRYALEDSRFLLRQKVDILVVACNTASALSLSTLREELNIPVFGVIEPGAAAAVAHTKRKRVGVIGTEATIKSMAYPEAIKRIDSGVHVISRPCPLFVPFAEEGWTDNHIAGLAAAEYLKDLSGKIDVLVLGCTHYPLLRQVIQQAVGDDVKLVCSSNETARVVKSSFKTGPATGRGGLHKFYVSDNPERFSRVGRRFLGSGAITGVSKVELCKGY